MDRVIATVPFMDRLLAAAPAPYNETVEYNRFINICITCCILSIIVLCYMSCLFSFFGEGGVLWVSKNLPIFKPRISFLSIVDQRSYLAFGETVLICLICLPIMVFIWLVGYWKTVIYPKKCRSLCFESIYVVLLVTFFYGLAANVVFVDVPYALDEKPSRKGRLLLFWPTFPFYFALGTCMLAGSLFSILVALIKVVMAMRGSNG